MKKLFTLIALLTCFLGAKAAQIVDKEVNFSEETSIHFYSWGGQGQEYFSLEDGCLHFHSDAATEVPWNVQVFPIGDVSVEAGVTYYLELKIKGEGGQTTNEGRAYNNIWDMNLQVGSANHSVNFDVPTEFDVITLQYDCTADGTGNVLFQCGNWVGDLWIEYMKIYHEGKEQKPVEWANIIVNGDASAEWENPEMGPQDANNGTVCAWGKEWGYLMNDVNAASGGAAIPVAHPAIIEDGVFVSRAKAVDPILYYAEDTDLGWAQRAAGEQMDDNTWQNQFWINFPRPLKEGESFKLSFRYRASEDVSVPSQYHQQYPGNYLTGGSIGNLSFTTEWQTYDKELTASANMQSVAFNLTGDGENWKRDIDFFFDDIQLSFMVLDEGYFAAASDIEDGDPEYDFDNAVEFEDSGDGLIAAVVGGESEDQWVNQVMVSTARGNDKGFKNNTLKVTGAILNDPENWMGYEGAANFKINLPVRGQWKIYLDTEDKLMSFEKLYGEEDKEILEVIPNSTEYVLAGLPKIQDDWDNQVWIAANRDLVAGEEVLIEFDYWMESEEAEEAGTDIQAHNVGADGAPCNYQDWNTGLPGPTFTAEKQHYSQTWVVPDGCGGMRSICFNMAKVAPAVDYHISNVVWMTSDKSEYLVDPEDEGSFFWGKVGQGAYYQNPAVPQPASDAVEGDVNGDGEVGVGDLISVSNYMADGEESGVTLEQADVNKDGEVGVGDLISISNIMAGKEEEE